MILLIQDYRDSDFLFFIKNYWYMTTEQPVSEKQAMKKKLIHNLIELVI